MAEVDGLFSHLQDLDDRLEDKLDEIVNAPGGDQRTKLKAEARKILGDYSKTLDAPFFQEIDAGNGFVSVKLASTARAALQKISDVLAA